MKMLRSKLIELKESERLANEQSIKGEIKKIEWGSQIRSYVFCPYTLVKDHRTGCEGGHGRGYPAVHHRLSEKELKNGLPAWARGFQWLFPVRRCV